MVIAGVNMQKILNEHVLVSAIIYYLRMTLKSARGTERFNGGL